MPFDFNALCNCLCCCSKGYDREMTAEQREKGQQKIKISKRSFLCVCARTRVCACVCVCARAWVRACVCLSGLTHFSNMSAIVSYHGWFASYLIHFVKEIGNFSIRNKVKVDLLQHMVLQRVSLFCLAGLDNTCNLAAEQV